MKHTFIAIKQMVETFGLPSLISNELDHDWWEPCKRQVDQTCF